MSTPELVDTRKTVTRQIIESAGIPLLFIEKESGQNGTLSLYPGSNTVETWLSADGATVSLSNGELVATRGLGRRFNGISSPKGYNFETEAGKPIHKNNALLNR